MANPGIFDINDTPFTLCKLDLESPNGNAFYRVGSPVEVSWTSEEVGDLTLAYKSSSSGDWVIVDESVPAGNNSYMWTPEEATNWCKIQLKETAYPEILDESNNNFVVFRLDLTAPSGGENLEWNDEFDISWDSEIATSVKIEFSSDNMESWSTIASSTSAGPGFYTWTIPEVISNQCYVKLSIPGLPDYYSVNTTPFSVAEIVGIESLDNNSTEFLVSPNPVKDKLHIQIEDNFYQEYSLEIISMNGVTTRVTEIYSGSNNLIDLSDLPDGLYLLKMKNNNSYSFQKIIKQTH